MSPRKAADVAAALQAKGMVADENHHTMYRMEVEGVTQVVTRISQGAREIDDNLMGLMARQCVLQLREFQNLVDCPLSAEAWRTIIGERCVDGRNPFLGR